MMMMVVVYGLNRSPSLMTMLTIAYDNEAFLCDQHQSAVVGVRASLRLQHYCFCYPSKPMMMASCE
jgi:hypothetical protein